MKNASPTSSVLSLLVLAIASTSMAAPRQNSREYRPLAAKAVRIQVAGSDLKGGKAAAKTREGWAHFDRKEWEPAMDAFLSALELDAADASAAEGLTMSVYRSGDRISAAELGEEFSTAMPWIRGMVVETLLVDVTAEVKRGDLAKLDALVERLPYAGGAYDPVREMVGENAGKKDLGKPVVSAPAAAPATTDLAIHSATVEEARPAMLVAQPLGGN
jgi:hypothetical protein